MDNTQGRILKPHLGFIPEDLRETDLVFGSNERVKHYITLDDANWFPYYSRGELQHGVYYDTSSCVTFSALNILEAWMNYLIRKNMLSFENMQWLKDKGYINDDGEFNCSDRFTAAMSGTTEEGNTATRVWDSIRNHGVVPEKVCPWDRGRDIPQEQKYAEWFRNPVNISDEAKALGLEFKARFDVLYERVRTGGIEHKKAIKHSPIHVFISPSCPYDSNKVQQPCDKPISHAVSQPDDDEPYTYIPCFDHYIMNYGAVGNERFIRKVSKDYSFYMWAFAITVVEKNVNNDMLKLIKGDKSSDIFTVGKDGVLRKIETDMKAVREGAMAGLWEEFDEQKHTVPQSDVDSMKKSDYSITFSI